MYRVENGIYRFNRYFCTYDGACTAEIVNGTCAGSSLFAKHGFPSTGTPRKQTTRTRYVTVTFPHCKQRYALVRYDVIITVVPGEVCEIVITTRNDNNNKKKYLKIRIRIKKKKKKNNTLNVKYHHSLLWCLMCRGRTQHGCSKYAAKKLSTTDSCSAADNELDDDDDDDEPVASSVAHDVAVGACRTNRNANANSRTAATVRVTRIFTSRRALFFYNIFPKTRRPSRFFFTEKTKKPEIFCIV